MINQFNFNFKNVISSTYITVNTKLGIKTRTPNAFKLN